MPEPTSSSAAAGIIGATAVLLASDPSAGDYAWLLCGALVGAMHSVGKIQTPNRWDAAKYVGMWVGTAFVLTFFISYLLEHYLGIPANRWPGVVAFGITFLADRWPSWAVSLIERRITGSGKGDGQ